MVMSTDRLREHLEPFLAVDSARKIRIGTRSVAYWPQRFVTDADADDVLRLFARVVASGRTLAVMGHYSHEVELAPRGRPPRGVPDTGHRSDHLLPSAADRARQRRRLDVGAAVAGRAVGGDGPVLHIHGRDTGPHDYFRVPVDRALRIFQDAYRALPGLARTVRGPVMSTTFGKVVVDGVEDSHNGTVFQLRLLQARDPRLIGRLLPVRYSETAAWLDELEPSPAAAADVVAAFFPQTPEGIP